MTSSSEIFNRHDPFDVPEKEIPEGVSYQWVPKDDLEKYLKVGRKAVPFSRHPFMGFNQEGNITIQGMVLIEIPTVDVQAADAVMVEKAQKNVEDWLEANGAQFSGGVIIANHVGRKIAFVGDKLISEKITERQLKGTEDGQANIEDGNSSSEKATASGDCSDARRASKEEG